MSMLWPVSGDVQQPTQDEAMAAVAAALAERGVARVPGRWPDKAAAWRQALRITECARGRDRLCAGLSGLEVVGEFTVPRREPSSVISRHCISTSAYPS